MTCHEQRLTEARAAYAARERTWIAWANRALAGAYETVVTPETVEHWRGVEAAGHALMRERKALEAYAASLVQSIAEDGVTHGS